MKEVVSGVGKEEKGDMKDESYGKERRDLRKEGKAGADKAGP
jgi:hypothetical protein